MKKLLLFFFLGVVACSSSEEVGPINEISDLIGKWYYESDTINGERHPYMQDFSNCPIPKEEYVEFTENGEIITFYYGDCKEDFDYGSYKLEGNVINASIGGVKFKATIKELSFTKFVMQYFQDIDGDGSIDTVVESYTR